MILFSYFDFTIIVIFVLMISYISICDISLYANTQAYLYSFLFYFVTDDAVYGENFMKIKKLFYQSYGFNYYKIKHQK
jgi:hypothetical protein